MTETTAILAPLIFDGAAWHEGLALRVRNGRVLAIAPPDPGDRVERVEGSLVPGLVDLQVNGGGGVLLNADPSPEGLARICAAQAGAGTTALLATLITDRPEVTGAAIAAVAAARAAGQPGLLGLHLEGPHIAPARKGTHDASLIRPMEAEDLSRLIAAAREGSLLMVTLAPEAATEDQVAALAREGVLVSLGHTEADLASARRYTQAGARLVTHLFNAMSPLAHRAPGLVGAALSDGRLSVGIIADGFHVDPTAIGIALRAKAGPGRVFLVSDAMATVGTDLGGFTLNGRDILRRGGRLTLADGTLAGADLDLLGGVRVLVREVGVGLGDALRMASLWPAEAAGIAARKGSLRPGADADALLLSDDLALRGVWMAGTRIGENGA